MTRKPILCLDFDGVIHSYHSGWTGADNVADGPTTGAMHFIGEAINHFNIAIFSSRSNQIGGKEAMQEWLMLHLADHHGEGRAREIFDLIQWPDHKPPAMVTLDDRAIQFKGYWPNIGQLLDFKPWNK